MAREALLQLLPGKWRDVGLKLGEERALGAWEGMWEAPEAPSTRADARDAEALGRKRARVGAGVGVGPGGDLLRGGQRALLEVAVEGGGDVGQLLRVLETIRAIQLERRYPRIPINSKLEAT